LLTSRLDAIEDLFGPTCPVEHSVLITIEGQPISWHQGLDLLGIEPPVTLGVAGADGCYDARRLRARHPW
jgi:hypothetical protein